MGWQLATTVLCLRQKFKYIHFCFPFSKRSCFIFVVLWGGRVGPCRIMLCQSAVPVQRPCNGYTRLQPYTERHLCGTIGTPTYTYRYDRTVPDAVRTRLRNTLNRLGTSSRRSELGGGGTSKVTVRRSSVHSHYRRRRVPKSAVYARPRTLAIHSYRTRNQTVFYKNFFHVALYTIAIAPVPLYRPNIRVFLPAPVNNKSKRFRKKCCGLTPSSQRSSCVGASARPLVLR